MLTLFVVFYLDLKENSYNKSIKPMYSMFDVPLTRPCPSFVEMTCQHVRVVSIFVSLLFSLEL